jgi:hypothetical protein
MALPWRCRVVRRTKKAHAEKTKTIEGAFVDSDTSLTIRRCVLGVLITPYDAIGVGMVGNARITRQNN